MSKANTCEIPYTDILKGGHTMIRGKNEKVFIGILIFFAVCFIYPQTASAHAPSDVQLSYDSTSQMLTVTITHPSPFSGAHYIKTVEIKKNGSVVVSNNYKNQPDQGTFAYSYKVPAIAGETLEATASCSLFGSRTANLTVGK